VQDRREQGTISGPQIVGVGGLLVGCVVLGLVVGAVADHALDSSPVGVLVGIGCGIVVGLVGASLRVAAYLRQ
jgi:F0F1-type ATP synthase assembly protein I